MQRHQQDLLGLPEWPGYSDERVGGEGPRPYLLFFAKRGRSKLQSPEADADTGAETVANGYPTTEGASHTYA